VLAVPDVSQRNGPGQQLVLEFMGLQLPDSNSLFVFLNARGLDQASKGRIVGVACWKFKPRVD